MANEQNLKRFGDLAPEEAKALRSKGGKKSGETRRRKKAFREYASMILSLRPKAKKKLFRTWENMGYDAEAEGLPSVAERIAMRLAERAMEDDDNALRLLMSYSHNPTMAEQIDLKRVEAMARNGAKLDVSVSREDSAVMDEVRRMMEGAEAAADERGAGDGIPVPDGAPGEVRADAGLHPADGAT